MSTTPIDPLLGPAYAQFDGSPSEFPPRPLHKSCIRKEARMASPQREYSLDFYLLDHLKFSGIERNNLDDLVNIVVSLKNKYGIVPHAAAAEGYPIRNALTASYVMESITLNKVINILLDIPRLHGLTIVPRGIPKSAQFDVDITLGG
jgi:hypothetical protein